MGRRRAWFDLQVPGRGATGRGKRFGTPDGGVDDATEPPRRRVKPPQFPPGMGPGWPQPEYPPGYQRDPT
jgi:hypothetical protein